MSIGAVPSFAKGAAFNRGRSKQDYATPDDLIQAVVKKFGPLALDLAADDRNTKAPRWFDEQVDSLKQDWVAAMRTAKPESWAWLNPPFGNIAPWAAKCSVESRRGGRILFLVPAAVGANWWRDYVHKRARVYFLNGRVCFDGKNGFPKDCALCVYGMQPGYEIWRWKP